MRSKTEEKQAAGVLFQVRDLLVRQHSRINILLHGHSVELNVMGSRGGQSALKLIRLLVDVEASYCPAHARFCSCWWITSAGSRLGWPVLITRWSSELRGDDVARWLMTIPVNGAAAITALAPAAATLRRGGGFCGVSRG
jgi:hypothetical protein